MLDELHAREDVPGAPDGLDKLDGALEAGAADDENTGSEEETPEDAARVLDEDGAEPLDADAIAPGAHKPDSQCCPSPQSVSPLHGWRHSPSMQMASSGQAGRQRPLQAATA